MLRVLLAGAMLCIAALGAERPQFAVRDTRDVRSLSRGMERKEGDCRILYDDGLSFEQQ